MPKSSLIIVFASSRVLPSFIRLTNNVVIGFNTIDPAGALYKPSKLSPVEISVPP